MGDQAVRGVEDGLRRAVVPREDDIVARGEVVREVQDDALVRATPGINRLVGVTDDA